jgi:hypothetical protein
MRFRPFEHEDFYSQPEFQGRHSKCVSANRNGLVAIRRKPCNHHILERAETSKVRKEQAMCR